MIFDNNCYGMLYLKLTRLNLYPHSCYHQVALYNTSGRGQLKRPVPKSKMATISPKWVPVIYLGVISLDSKFLLSSPLNDSDMNNSFSSNFCYQECSGATFKYYIMLG